MNEIFYMSDMTQEEAMLVQLVKQRMLMKLNDRYKFVFLYVYELGHTQYDVAQVLNVSESRVSNIMDRIRKNLAVFNKNVNKKP